MVGSTLPAKDQEAVILLHGLCRSSKSMEKMEQSLSQEGYVVINVDYPSTEHPIEALSDLAIGNTLQSELLEGCHKVHFVTHSLGGIILRYYFKHHQDDRLSRVVMLGPPNQGSEVVDEIGDWWAFKKLNGPAGNQLSTESTSIPNQLGAVEFELGVIAGDRSINWINSTMIKGKDDGKVSIERTKVEGMKQHIVLHATHPFLMKKKAVIAQVIAFLKTGEFASLESLGPSK